jgi:hypothetical protein
VLKELLNDISHRFNWDGKRYALSAGAHRYIDSDDLAFAVD